tara:strand:- start:45 stop:296 length:252 start_codon:yes stop_codon:yes gene_type:complete
MSIAFSGKGVQDYSVNESVSPYTKAVVSTTADMDACRAIYVKSGASHTLTINGVDVAFTGMLPGTIYPICATKCSTANVIFLY